MKNTCKNFKSKMFTLVCCNFSVSPREGKFKPKNNQLFSWLKKEGKTEASSDGWSVGPVSASPGQKALFHGTFFKVKTYASS